MRVLAVAPGDDRHGVTQHLLTVAALVGADVQRDLEPPTQSYDVVHVPFTDALWGPDIATAAARFEAWAGAVRQRLVVTLHDVPGIDADPDRDARRAAGYRKVAGAAQAVVVCSSHEAGRLDPRPHVVPLPVEPLQPPALRPGWADHPTIGVLGFIYPGKGHHRVIAAATGTGARVVVIGGPSPGHEGLVEQLHAQARAAGVELIVTGRLSEPALHAAALAVTVPVAAYATLGASGSLMTWISAGRRPVTTSGAYADELAGRWPGSLLLAGDLGVGLRTALADPSSTWSAGPPDRPDVGALHRAVYRSVLT